MKQGRPRGGKAGFAWCIIGRPEHLGYVEEVKSNAQAEYIVKNGKPTAVIIPIDEYEQLMEDLHDLAVMAKRKDEPTVPLAEVKRRLIAHGKVRR